MPALSGWHLYEGYCINFVQEQLGLLAQELLAQELQF